MKYVLSLQTAEYPNDIALLSTKGKLIAYHKFSEREKTTENLNKELKKILKKEQLRVDDIELFVVCLGPGSYTGLRGGLAFAKGFCQYAKIPLVGVDAFESILADDSNVISLLDARNERVYYKQKGKIKVGNIEKILSNISKSTTFIGSGAQANKALIEQKHGIKSNFKKNGNALIAENVGRTGIKKYKKNPSIFTTEYLLKLKPLYILEPKITISKKRSSQ